MITLQQLKNALKAILNSIDVKVGKAKDALTEYIDGLPQSSWAQNDETAKDFIVSRTHYEYIAPEVLFEKQEAANNTGIVSKMYSIPKLTFIIDDEEYELSFNKEQLGQYIYSWYGNGNIYESGLPNTGEPFVFINTRIYFKDGNAHTVEILGEDIIHYKPLSEHFIPESVSRVGHTHTEAIVHTEQTLEEAQYMQARKNMDLYSTDVELIFKKHCDLEGYEMKYCAGTVQFPKLEVGATYRIEFNSGSINRIGYAVCNGNTTSDEYIMTFYSPNDSYANNILCTYTNGYLRLEVSGVKSGHYLYVDHVALFKMNNISRIPDVYIPNTIARKSDIPTVTNGKSAYEYAKDGGYDGTEEQFANDFANILKLASNQ